MISKLDAIRIVFRMDGEATALRRTTEAWFGGIVLRHAATDAP